MKRWQVRAFSMVFWELPIPPWVMASRVRVADLVMYASGITAAALQPHHPMASAFLLGFALAIGVLLLGWHTYIKHRVHQYFHRVANGLCLTCGYDLRATPDCCPECGAARS